MSRAPHKLHKAESDPLTMITPEVTKYIMKHEVALAAACGVAQRNGTAIHLTREAAG